ncbi:MAG: hypothetical protein M0C28_02835 [Candidatus Moduliflexus flocculans]|nr:hypothetical protein [Candidatus Moduliflexus flocculans]
MNEVEELSKLDPAGLPPLKPLLLDDLYQSVLKNLHLELGRGPVLYLLSPSYSVLNPTPDEGITDFITRNETLLDYLKEAIVQNLAEYSVLVDVSSYFIEQNNGLVLARLRERDSDGPAVRDQVLHPLAPGAPVPLRGQDLHRPGLRRPVHAHPQVLRPQGRRRLAQGPVRTAVRAGRVQAQESPGFRLLLPGDRRFGGRAPQRGPAHPAEPAAAPRTTPSSPARTSSRSTPSTGRSTTSSSSSTRPSPSSRTSCASRSARTSCGTSRSSRRT